MVLMWVGLHIIKRVVTIVIFSLFCHQNIGLCFLCNHHEYFTCPWTMNTTSEPKMFQSHRCVLVKNRSWTWSNILDSVRIQESSNAMTVGSYWLVYLDIKITRGSMIHPFVMCATKKCLLEATRSIWPWK